MLQKYRNSIEIPVGNFTFLTPREYFFISYLPEILLVSVAKICDSLMKGLTA